MIVGVPKEVKDHEYRVALTPIGVANMNREGHTVVVQTGAGAASGFTDEEYLRAGAQLFEDAAEVWGRAEMIVKVKEPVATEFEWLRPGLVVFTYLHLAALPDLTGALLASQVTGVAYETVALDDGF